LANVWQLAKPINFICIFAMFKSKYNKMATIKFRIRSNANKNVTINVYLSTKRGHTLEVKTGFSINPKDWSVTTARPKQNNPENKILNSNLNKLETYIFENLNNDLANGILIDRYWIENKINDCFNRVVKTDNTLLVNHIQYIINNANTRKITGKNKLGLSQNRIKGYTTFKNLISIYETEIKKPINFLDINKTFVDKFTNWLINSKMYSMNYSGKQIDNLKTVCIDAQKNEIKTNEYVNQIKGFSENDEDRYIQTLSFEELEKIRTVELPNEKLNNARNWLLIGCEIGQRGGDLLNITKNDIRYNKGKMYLDIIQEKTKKNVTVIIINPYIIEIIENSFPHKISSQKLNNYIKDVCKLANIIEVIEGKKHNSVTKRKEKDFYPKYELITSHSCRRSFATNYYKKIPTAILIGITGHSKESLFLTYINKREDKDANADLFMKFYEELNKDKKPEMKVIRNVV
jgi:integrase